VGSALARLGALLTPVRINTWYPSSAPFCLISVAVVSFSLSTRVAVNLNHLFIHILILELEVEARENVPSSWQELLFAGCMPATCSTECHAVRAAPRQVLTWHKELREQFTAKYNFITSLQGEDT
jgi:hypothetical protein